MPDHRHDAFGRLVVDPQRLTQPERVDILRGLAGDLQAGRSLEQQWLGARLSEWLERGGDLVDVLGLRPPRGSRVTAQAIVQADRRRTLLLRLSAEVGSDRAAAQILAGRAPCPPAAHHLVQQLQALRSPTSTAAFSRARGASRDTR